MDARFYAKVKTDTSCGCHLWTGALSLKGYGKFFANHQNRLAHRIAWELANGPIPKGMWVLHHCDNPPCVNPQHLFLGNNTDNMRDMVAKGRSSPTHGEFGHKTRLTNEQVIEIRGYARNVHNQKDLAHRFGVSFETIKAIQYRRNWRHL